MTMADRGVPTRRPILTDMAATPIRRGHVPWNECQSAELFLDAARRDLDGDDLGLNVYCATEYRFGEQRTAVRRTPTRLVLETWATGGTNEQPSRISLPVGEALRLVRLVNRVVDEISFPSTP